MGRTTSLVKGSRQSLWPDTKAVEGREKYLGNCRDQCFTRGTHQLDKSGVTPSPKPPLVPAAMAGRELKPSEFFRWKNLHFNQETLCARQRSAAGQASNPITVSLHIIIYDPGLDMHFQEQPFELGGKQTLTPFDY